MIFGFNTDVKVGKTVYHVQSEARRKEHLLQTQVFLKGRCIGKHATSYADKLASPGFSDEQMHALLKEQHKHIVELVRAGNVEAAVDALLAKHSIAAAEASSAVAPLASAAAEAAAAVSGPDIAQVSAAAAASPDSVSEPPPLPSAPAKEAADGISATAPAPESRQAEPPLPHRAIVLPPLEVAPPPQVPAPSTAVALEPVGIATEKGLKLEWIQTEAVFADNNLIVQLQVLTDDGRPVAEAQLTARLTIGQTSPAYIYATTDGSGNAVLRSPISSDDLRECSILVQASFRGKSASRRLRVRLHG